MTDLVRNCPPKPERGSHWREGRERRAARSAHERREMEAAKRRDGYVCRWPKCSFMTRKPRIEAAHVIEHRKMGGDPTGELTQRHLLMALCVIHHSRVDRIPGWDVEPVTDAGTDGVCAFYRPDPETGERVHIATETRIGVSVMRSGR